GSFAQLDARETELAVYTVWAASHAAAVTLTHGARITRQFLQGNLGIPTIFNRCIDVADGGLEFSTLGSVLGNQASPFGLAVRHADFSHCLTPSCGTGS